MILQNGSAEEFDSFTSQVFHALDKPVALENVNIYTEDYSKHFNMVVMIEDLLCMMLKDTWKPLVLYLKKKEIPNEENYATEITPPCYMQEKWKRKTKCILYILCLIQNVVPE